VGAIEHFNQSAQPPEVLVLVRGGGSADDLAAFSDEPLVRAIAASRIPTLVGVGHEVDVSLADMVADVRAATPTNAAQLLVSDRREIATQVDAHLVRMARAADAHVRELNTFVTDTEKRMYQCVVGLHQDIVRRAKQAAVVLMQLDPRAALNRGYALVRSPDGSLVKGAASGVSKGQVLTIETAKAIIKTGVQDVSKK
jgi:exodeoxyribonuclease VII large subunit